MDKFKVLTCFVYSFFILNSVHATEYPWVDLTSRDLRVIENPKVESQFRLSLLTSAEETIDVVTYDQRLDDAVGRPLLEALRSAADRGVRVRFIRGGTIPKLYSDPLFSDKVADFLHSPPTSTPIQYLFSGGVPMFKRGWSIFSGVHEKLIVIDRKIAFVTGRGHSEEYLNWLDTCFVLKGKLVAHSEIAFNELWDSVIRETHTRLYAGEERPIEDENTSYFASSLNKLSLDNEELKQVSDLMYWASGLPPEDGSIEKKIPMKGRLLHHNFFKQMRDHCENLPFLYNIFDCAKKLQDPVTNEMVKLVKDAMSVKFTTLSPVLNPALKKALLDRLQNARRNPFRLEILTNSKESHRSLFPYPVAWFAGLGDIMELKKAGADIFSFEATPESPLTYLHRKLAIVKMNSGKTHVIFGSHNLTDLSTSGQDEMSFEIESNELGEQMDEIFARSLKTNGREVTSDQIEKDKVKFSYPAWGWGRKPWKWLLGVAQSLI